MLVFVGCVLAVLVGSWLAMRDDGPLPVLESDRSTAMRGGADGLDAGEASRSDEAPDRFTLDAVNPQVDLPDPDEFARPEPTLPPGRSIEYPNLTATRGAPEVHSPLPTEFELEEFDGPLVRAEYEDGILWFEAQRALNADGRWEREGFWNCWHSNGELHEQGEYRAGLAHGSWTWWYPDGNRMSTGHFVNGERHGDWTWYFDTGELAMGGRYAGGEGVGAWTLYYPSGGRQASGSFIDGRASGPWTVWTEDGTVNHERTGNYSDGELVE